MSKIEYRPEDGKMFRILKDYKKQINLSSGSKIKVDGKTYSPYKLIWIYMNDTSSSRLHVGHINGIDTDFRFSNLINLEANCESVQLTQERIKLLLDYNEDSGIVTRKFTQGGQSGDIKDTRVDGYQRIFVDGKRYLLHRIIWLFVYGEFPVYQIDHIDHNRSNNKLNNLREVTNSENAKNRSLASNNTSGKIGIYRKKNGMYESSIKIDGKHIYLGTFSTENEAITVRKNVEALNGFHVNHGRK